MVLHLHTKDIWRSLKPNDYLEQSMGNKAKGRISKRVFQQNKARQIFRKMNIS